MIKVRLSDLHQCVTIAQRDRVKRECREISSSDHELTF